MILESSISMLSAVNLHLHCGIQCLMGPQRLVEMPTKTLIWITVLSWKWVKQSNLNVLLNFELGKHIQLPKSSRIVFVGKLRGNRINFQ